MRKCRSWISICLVLALLLTASVGSASADQFAAAASSAVSGDACVQKAETAGEIDPFTSRKASNWCVCGTVNGSNWDKELPMTEVGDNVFAVSLYMRTGDELKVRQRGIWDTNIGAFGVSQGASLVAQESGKYTVRLSFPDEAEVELIPEWKNSRWSVIGTVNGTGWDTDFPMEEGSGGVYTLEMDLFAGEELKVRRDRSWDVNIGAGGALNGDNVVVTETGRYTIRLSVRDGSAASLELIPVASTVQASSGWSVVGTLNGTNWKKDYPMHDLGYGRFESDPLQLRDPPGVIPVARVPADKEEAFFAQRVVRPVEPLLKVVARDHHPHRFQQLQGAFQRGAVIYLVTHDGNRSDPPHEHSQERCESESRKCNDNSDIHGMSLLFSRPAHSAGVSSFSGTGAGSSTGAAGSTAAASTGAVSTGAGSLAGAAGSEGDAA